jgi:MFS transporter, PPP family, 3-phenylpropionic acid transporter
MPGAMARPLWPFGVFFFAYFVYVGVFTPYLSLYLAELKFSIVEIGLLVSMLQVLRIVGPNLWGWLADRSEARITMFRIATVGAVLAFLPMFWARGLVAMFAVLIVLNLFVSGLTPLSEALTLRRIGTDFPRYGRLRLWGSIGYIVAVALGGVLLDRLGTLSLPWLAMLGLLGVGWAAWQLYDVPHAHDPQAPVSVRALLRQPTVLLFFSTCFLMIFAHGALYAYLSLYLEGLGYSKTAIGLLWALGVVSEVVFFYFQAQVMRRFAPGSLLIASFVIAAARFGIIGAWAQSLAWLVFAQCLHAITFGVHHAASLTLLRRWFSGRLAARGQALYTSVSYGLGGTLGGLGAAWIWKHIQPSAAFYASACAALIGAGVALGLARRVAAPKQF